MNRGLLLHNLVQINNKSFSIKLSIVSVKFLNRYLKLFLRWTPNLSWCLCVNVFVFVCVYVCVWEVFNEIWWKKNVCKIRFKRHQKAIFLRLFYHLFLYLSPRFYTPSLSLSLSLSLTHTHTHSLSHYFFNFSFLPCSISYFSCRSPDGDTEYFDIVAGVLQRDTLAPYLFIICLDYVLRTSIDKIRENGFELTKRRSKRYPAKTITDADYADDLALLANTPNQAETLLHSLERAAAGIGLHVNAFKTEYMCYNQTGNITTLDGASLKLVDKFPYLGSSVSSTEKDINTRLTKAWTAIDRL